MCRQRILWILAMFTPLVATAQRCAEAQGLRPGDTMDYKSLAFYPERWKDSQVSTRLVPWEGQKVVFLTTTADFDHEVMARFVERLDAAWELYADLTGSRPERYRQFHGKATIAAVPDPSLTCGYGCGYIGASGIEVAGFYDSDYPLAKRDSAAFSHYLFYEMGRNYYTFAERHSIFLTGYAVFMRYVCMDALKCTDPDAQTRATIENCEAVYAASDVPFLTAFTNLAEGEKGHRLTDAQGRAVEPSDQPVMYATAMLKLRKENGGDEWVKNFFHQLASCPPSAGGTQSGALAQCLNWLVAASAAAGKDLTPLFADRWRMPLTAAQRAFMGQVEWTDSKLEAGTIVAQLAAQAAQDGGVDIAGELRQWHKVTLSLRGPYATELDNDPNPFTDYCLRVKFTHESGTPSYLVPGYFAADGRAGETSAQSGRVWRAHLSPDKAGVWNYEVSFVSGPRAALMPDVSVQAVKPLDGQSGSFRIQENDKKLPDFRAAGRLQYVGQHHLRFAGSGRYFLKAGADAPETLLAYVDFDGTAASKRTAHLKTWHAHEKDWRPGDPTWQNGKGKGLIGALNYLSNKGVNAFSFLPYNAGGDGDNIWPFISRDDKLHYDCSKLDQWGVVFDHATNRGLYLHFKLQENEMDDDRLGYEAKQQRVPESLDGGKLGPERRLYCRELIARFAHELALNWNIGEENTQSTEEIREMVQYLRDVDPYDHHIVLHTFPDQQDKVYRPLLGDKSQLTGVSLQNDWSAVHQLTLEWIRQSNAAGRSWVVANDEQNPASLGVPPDPGYGGQNGQAQDGKRVYTLHDIRKATLWGNLMAGGAGVEYYFGYELPQHDLLCEDYRSRDKSWDYCRIALQFFRDSGIPFWEMTNADELVGNSEHDNSRYCLAKPGELYLVYLPDGGTAQLQLDNTEGKYRVQWFNPRSGGDLADGSVGEVMGGTDVTLGHPPDHQGTPAASSQSSANDWLVVVRRP